MNVLNFQIAALIAFTLTGCASRRAGGEAALKSGIRYTARLGEGLVAEVKADQKSGSIDIYIMREDEIVAQFGAAGHLITSQMTLNAERGERTINVFARDGTLVTHSLSTMQVDEFTLSIVDRDGDFFPDEQIDFDWTAGKKTRQAITHSFVPAEEENN